MFRFSFAVSSLAILIVMPAWATNSSCSSVTPVATGCTITDTGFYNAGLNATGNSFSGTFNLDNNIQVFEIDITVATTLTIQTFSYGGGPDFAGNAVVAGGFAPDLALFGTDSGVPDYNLVATNGGASYCGAGNPGVGGCQDASITLTVNPGTYYLALTEQDNYYQGLNNSGNGGLFVGDVIGNGVDPTAFQEGFSNPGVPNFTGPNCGGSAPFCDPFGDQMDGDYELDIMASNPAVPEPGSFGLAFLGFAFAFFLLRRSRSARGY
jgi:hypothetical protein